MYSVSRSVPQQSMTNQENQRLQFMSYSYLSISSEQVNEVGFTTAMHLLQKHYPSSCSSKTEKMLHRLATSGFHTCNLEDLRAFHIAARNGNIFDAMPSAQQRIELSRVFLQYFFSEMQYPASHIKRDLMPLAERFSVKLEQFIFALVHFFNQKITRVPLLVAPAP